MLITDQVALPVLTVSKNDLGLLTQAFGVIQMLITDQVATAPCTDCVQERSQTFGVIKLNYYKELLTLFEDGPSLTAVPPSIGAPNKR